MRDRIGRLALITRFIGRGAVLCCLYDGAKTRKTRINPYASTSTWISSKRRRGIRRGTCADERLISHPRWPKPASWSSPRRVVPKVELHLGELFPRVGHLSRAARAAANRARARPPGAKGPSVQRVHRYCDQREPPHHTQHGIGCIRDASRPIEHSVHSESSSPAAVFQVRMPSRRQKNSIRLLLACACTDAVRPERNRLDEEDARLRECPAVTRYFAAPREFHFRLARGATAYFGRSNSLRA
jgi:hypothetical protein